MTNKENVLAFFPNAVLEFEYSYGDSYEADYKKNFSIIGSGLFLAYSQKSEDDAWNDAWKFAQVWMLRKLEQ
jgi:hypothetical protein